MGLIGREGEKGRFLQIPKEMSEKAKYGQLIFLLWDAGFTGHIALSLHLSTWISGSFPDREHGRLRTWVISARRQLKSYIT